MSDSVLYSVFLLVSLGMIAAIVLYVVSKKFYVYENPLISDVDDILPAANCGGCGSPGCKAFAEKLVNTDDISELFCPVGGNDVMKQVSEILNKEVAEIYIKQEKLQDLSNDSSTVLRLTLASGSISLRAAMSSVLYSILLYTLSDTLSRPISSTFQQ